MKIAMLDPSLFTGRYDDGLCHALGEAGHEVHLLGRPMRETDAILPTTYSYEPHFFAASERLRGMMGDGAVFRAAKAAEYLASAHMGSLRALVQSDVVHVQWLPFPAADVALLERLRRIAHRPALVHTVHNASAFHGDAGVQGRGYRSAFDLFDALIVHGEATRAALRAQGVAEEMMHVIPHPPMELAVAGESDLATVSEAERPRILFFGTIRPYKGFDLLIDAAKRLWAEGLDFELAVAGKPFMDVEAVLAPVRSEKRLILDLAFLTEQRLDAHLRKAGILAFPYRHIDSSGAFLSSLHYGKAMVASKVGMFAELPEEAVKLVSPDDVGALADALRELICKEAERGRLGAGALALRASMGQWSNAAAATLAVYEAARERARAA